MALEWCKRSSGKTIFALTGVFFGLLLALTVVTLTAGRAFNNDAFAEPVHALTQGWTYAQGGMEEAVELPHRMRYGTDGRCILSTVLQDPGDLFASPVVRVSSNHFNFQAYLDGQLLYRYEAQGMGASKSPGNAYHYLRLPAGYGGKTLEIHIQMLLGDTIPYTMETPLLGAKGAILMQTIRADLPQIAVVTLTMLFGLVTLGLTLLLRRQLGFSASLFYTGVFAVAFALYAYGESETIRQFVRNTYLLYLLTFTTLAFLPVPILMICRDSVDARYGSLLTALAGLSLVNIAVQLVAHFAGWLDLRSAVPITHALVAAGAILLVLATLGSKAGGAPQRNRLLWSIAPMLLGMAVDLMIFYSPIIFHANSLFFQIGVLLFVIIQLLYLVLQYFSLYRETLMADYYKRIAYLDVLTGLGNRRAFEQQIEAINQGEAPSEGLYCVTCDINNLKWANDTLGHSQGDTLIADAAALLQAAFGAQGQTFRTGGDEFVAFVRQPPEAMQQALYSLQAAISDYNGCHEVALSLAVGAARYVPDGPSSLLQVLTESDQRMYVDKKAQKAQGLTKDISE